MLLDAVMSLSLANLCFIKTWSELLNSPIRRFNTCLAIIINVLLLGGVVFGAITLARHSGKSLPLRLARFVFPLLILIPVNGFIQPFLPKQKLILSELGFLVLAVIIIGLFEVDPWHQFIIRAATTLTLVLSPFLLITMIQVFWSLMIIPDKQLASPLSVRNTSAPRVVWFLFDEMDQQLAFSTRPATLHLSELDRLRSQAIYATNAYPPSDSTPVSMPALITGKLLSNTKLINTSEMEITFADSERPVGLSNQPNIFSRAREAGFNTALVGWYIPYCSIIGGSLTSCDWIDTEAATLRGNLSKQIENVINIVPLASEFGVINVEKKLRNHRKKAVDSYIEVLNDAKRVVSDPNLGLILVHWPVPHAPNIYSRQENDFETDGESSYIDNLQLADRTLGEMRAVMEEAGNWDDSIVLVTSDHWWRPFIWRSSGPWTREDENTPKSDTDHRIPFILKLARQEHEVTCDAVFNNILIHDLILALMRGEVATPDSVVGWIDKHRSIGESPYRFEIPK